MALLCQTCPILRPRIDFDGSRQTQIVITAPLSQRDNQLLTRSRLLVCEVHVWLPKCGDVLIHAWVIYRRPHLVHAQLSSDQRGFA